MKRIAWMLLCVANFGFAEPMAGYLMGYFTESPNRLADSRALHLAVSDDALNWTPLNQNQPVLIPTLGEKGLRDPFFLRKADGTFVILATNLKDQLMRPFQTIHVWDTKDFITFENDRLLKMHDNPGMRTWAPEAFWDPEKKKYGIVWSGNTDYYRTYVNYTADFKTVEPAQLYFDPGFNQIDATFYSGEEGNFLYFKDWTVSRLRGAWSDSLAPGSFDDGVYTRPLQNGLIETMEAPLLLKLHDQKRWYLYGDSYRPINNEFYIWQTDDITKAVWKPMDQSQYNMPLCCKHGSIIPITKTEMDRLVAHWGKPQWNRIKCFSNPDLLIRHSAYKGVVSPYPFDPYTDSMWTLQPGLADAKGVSFEAEAFPGYYLCEQDGELVLAENNEKASFAESATFLKEPGLADERYASFRAPGSSAGYIRHRDGALCVENIRTKQEKEAATFLVVY